MKLSDATYALRLFAHSRTEMDSLLPGRIRPYIATVRITERCNSRCITCNYWQKDYKDSLDTKAAINLSRQLAELGVSRLRFSGGEPLLRQDFFTVLKGLRDLGFSKITVSTNGLLIDRLADHINQSCLTDLAVSIDGLRENNDRLRGVPGYFDRVMEGLKLIENKQITIMTTLHDRLAEDLPELLGICEERGYLWDYNLPDNRLYFLKDVDLESVVGSAAGLEKTLECINKLRHLECARRLSEMKIDYSYQYLTKAKIKEPHCYLGFMELMIDSQGNVLSGCQVLPPVGNILRDSLKEILCTETYRKRLRKMVARNCPGCVCGYGVNVILENLPKYAISQLLGRKGVSPA